MGHHFAHLGAVLTLVLACGVSAGAADDSSGGASSEVDTGAPPACGDGVCGADESCDACSADCGPCAPLCDDDGACEPGETCEACPGDCGSCDAGAPCARLNAAQAGETVVISGEMGDDREGAGLGCDVHAAGSGVTVTGSWRGDLRCHHCDGWLFDHVTVSEGSLRMIAGDGWIIRDSAVDGGGRGIMAVVGTGSDDAPDGQAINWIIERLTSRGAGCRPIDDPYPTHVRALYIIGKNGQPNHGVIRDSTFEGEGCGATVKIGGTGNFGSWSGAPDAADDVIFERNVVRNLGAGPERVALLLATNSDEVTVANNRLVAGEHAIVASGPWSGLGLEVTDNTIDAPVFMLARLWNNPGAGALANLFGERFVTYEEPGSCPDVGLCSGNERGSPADGVPPARRGAGR